MNAYAYEKARSMRGLEQMLTREEVAEYFQVSTATIRNWEKHNRLPAIKIAHRVRYSPQEVYQWWRQFHITAEDDEK